MAGIKVFRCRLVRVCERSNTRLRLRLNLATCLGGSKRWTVTRTGDSVKQFDTQAEISEKFAFLKYKQIYGNM